MNFLTFISHVVSFQFKQPLFIYVFNFSRGLQANTKQNLRDQT